jgi:hypothetical protein
MERIKEREYLRYVVAYLDDEGRAVYLHSLHGGKYRFVEEIEYATKLNGKKAADIFYQFACQDLPYRELVLLPVMISYELIKTDEADEDVMDDETEEKES